jgi:anti-sigma regulatory factor (Ser/Thr protein kinase)
VPAPSVQHLVVSAEVSSIRAVRCATAAFAQRAGAGPETVGRVRLAVSEAATNAVRHAYDDGRAEGEIRASMRVEHAGGAGGGVLVVAVSDDGPGVRPRSDSPGLGLGLPLIAQSADAVDIVDDRPGATVCMRYALP